MSLPRILLVTLGGTIAMTRSASGSGIVPTLGAADLLGAVPELGEVADILSASPFQMPGASLRLEHLGKVADLLEQGFANGCAGAVVVQGTDTIEETSFVLDRLVAGSFPVVVTGAMRGAQAPGADGPANLLAATLVAGAQSARGLGTLVVLNDEIHAARFVQKCDTGLPSAFASPLCGPIGHIREKSARFHVELTRRACFKLPAEAGDIPVALLKIGLGDDGRLIDAVAGHGFRGAVIEAMGAGHVPDRLVPAIERLAAKIPVVLATRIVAGPVFTGTYGFPGSEIDLIGRGVIAGADLSSLKIRLLLQLLIASGAGNDAIREIMESER